MQNRYGQGLFWAGLAFFLLVNLPQLLAAPVQFADGGRNPLIISEVALDANVALSDGEGRNALWIELYNRSPRAVDLAGWTLTDEPDQPGKWTLPGHRLESGGYRLVLATGQDRSTDVDDADDNGPYLQANFRLDTTDGFLALYPPTSRLYLDSQPLRIHAYAGAASYGYDAANNTYRYLTVATPGATNDLAESWQQIEKAVVFSVDSGYYDQPFRVALASDVPGAVIRYSTNGDEPTESAGTIYSGPIRVTHSTVLRAAAWAGEAHPSPATARTYLFPEDILHQPVLPPGFPEKWGTYRIDRAGYTSGAPVVGDYGLDQRLVGNERDRRQVVEGLRSLPALSLVMDVQHFAEIYSDPQRHGLDTERPVSVEMFYPEGGPEGFQINSGIRIQGGASRWEHIPKHSFRLLFRDTYGAGKLRYPLFANSPVAEFDTLILRAGMQDSFVGHSTTLDRGRLITYIRDEWMRATQVQMTDYGVRGIFAHLYINGLYWGLYNVVERPDQDFAAAYFGGPREEWYAANHGGSIAGATDRFDVLIRLAEEAEEAADGEKEEDSANEQAQADEESADAGLANPQRYATMLEFIDPVRFSDYLILNWYIGNGDWPRNNWYVTVNYPAGRNHFYIWDGEKGLWGDGPAIVLDQTNVQMPWPDVIKEVFEALMQNPEYQMLLADRLYADLFNGGALAVENAQARWLALAALIEKAIPAESARWGDVWFDPPLDLSDWYTARDAVLLEMGGNSQRLLDLARAEGYYPAIDPPHFGLPGGTVDEGIGLALEAGLGTIYFTTDGSDPRQAGGAPSPSAQIYRGPLVISAATTLRARLLSGAVWSALAQAHYALPQQTSDVRITEIMYNPIGGELYEYLELTNLGDLPADLSLARFEGIDLIFPLDTVLQPGESRAVIKDFAKFRERYPEAPFMGLYRGRLSNGGETIALRDRTGTLITAARYDDENEWPWSADGRGDSLVLARPEGDPNAARSWRVSPNLYGSPGATDPQPAR